ncbi:hypothetical protein VTL71DRAFT_15163 [Oculimacula yallundae]|uniref:Uncharacterized protein n=1 Tax=Oculimacula yallundae TaxID=86028 RepID=A0ABR4CFT4_9HELO
MGIMRFNNTGKTSNNSKLLTPERVTSAISQRVRQCTFFCPREIQFAYHVNGLPEWSVLVDANNTYPFMRVKSKDLASTNGLQIVNFYVVKTKVRLNDIRFPFGSDSTNRSQLLFIAPIVGQDLNWSSTLTINWLWRFLLYLSTFRQQELPCGGVNILFFRWACYNPPPPSIVSVLHKRLKPKVLGMLPLSEFPKPMAVNFT